MCHKACREARDKGHGNRASPLYLNSASPTPFYLMSVCGPAPKGTGYRARYYASLLYIKTLYQCLTIDGCSGLSLEDDEWCSDDRLSAPGW